MRSRALAIVISIIAGALAWTDSAWSTGASADRLAFSQKLGAEVSALPDSSGGWCASSVSLRVTLNNDSVLLSPLVKTNRAAFAVRLGSVITQQCSVAETATVQFVKGSDQSQVDSQAIARNSSGWASVAQTSPAMSTPPAASSPPPPPVVTLSTPVAPPPEVRPASLEVGEDYEGMLVKMLRDNPDLAKSDPALRWWAELRFPSEYFPVQNQEFALQPLLAKANADLTRTIAISDPDRITIHIRTQFQAYDFAAQRFPVSINGNQFNLSPRYCCAPEGLPRTFTVTVAGLDSISGFPMSEADARAFEQRRTVSNSVNRSIWVAVTVKLPPGPVARDAWSNYSASGAIAAATFYGDSNYAQLVYSVSEAEIGRAIAAKAAADAAAAAADRAKLAEAQRQQIAAQRDLYIQQLQSSSASTKLANFVLPGPPDLSVHLDSLRAARAAALIAGRAVDVTMLIQAYSSGTDGIPTKWPGHLSITTPNGQSLVSSGWYIVRGALSVPPGDNLPDADLVATSIYACQKDLCAEATDATAIIDHKLAYRSE
jgi:hypothetical protein